MNLVERARNILLAPQTEWAVIETEPTDPKTLYTSYIAILALIPAVAGLIFTVFLLMKVPESKVVAYTAVVVVVAIVVGFAIAMINASIIGMGAVGMVSGIR